MPTKKTAKTTTERAQLIQELRDKLTTYQGSLGEEQVALICARFDGYSERNALLIAMQCPTATDVSGFKAWRARGRCVRKGEKGIQILAPAGAYADKAEGAVQPAESTGQDGQTGEKVRLRFRIAYVFDIAQTDPIKEKPAAEIDANSEAAEAAEIAELEAEAA